MRYMHDDINLLPGCQLPDALMVLTLLQDWNRPSHGVHWHTWAGLVVVPTSGSMQGKEV